jgi:DNA-binding NtrC family response regulator
MKRVISELRTEAPSETQPTLLVIDDDPVFLKRVQIVMEQAHYNVVGMNAGLGAVSRIKEHKISLVILDILMEDHEGIETLMEIREAYPELPVIMVSIDPFYLSFTQQLGANEAMEKPISFEVLLSSVKRLLSQVGRSLSPA